MVAGRAMRLYSVHYLPGVLLLTILAVLSPSCDAVYEDQVGVWDWHQQYIGKVTQAIFQTSGSGRKRVVVATEQNAIASLNLRTGEIYWRRVLGETDVIDSLNIAGGKLVITLSSGGTSVRAWHLSDGVLIWESFVQPSLISSPAKLVVMPIDINNDGASDLLVFNRETLYALSSTDGATLWKSNIPTEGNFKAMEISLTVDSNLYGVGFSGSSGLGVFAIDPRNGDVGKPTVAHYSGDLDTSKIIIVDGYAVARDSNGIVLMSVQISTEEGMFLSATPVASLVPYTFTSIELLSTKLEGAFVIAINDKLVIIKVDQGEGRFSTLAELDHCASVADSLAVTDSKHAVAIVQPSGSGSSHKEYTMQVVDADNWKEEAVQEAVSLDNHRGSIKKVFLNSYIRLDRSHGFRALVVLEDDSLALLQQGTVVWIREDGLASIVDIYASELPFERGVSVTEVEHDLAEWLKGHWLKLKATLFLANSEDVAAVQALRLHSAEKSKMTRDHNGFRKLLVVLTKSGKMYALHTGDGRIVWSLLMPSFQEKVGTPTAFALKLLPWEIPHQHALDKNPVVLVLGKLGSGPNAPGILSWVDVRTGTELRSVRLLFPIRQAIPLPLTDSSEQRLHLFVDDQVQAHIFPVTTESLGLFVKHKPNIFFHVVDKDAGRIDGYTIKDKAVSIAEEHSDGFVFHTHKIWSVVFPSDTKVISTVAARRADEVVHTQAKVLGNRDVLYKYLNKNLIFVATVTPKAAGFIGEATPEEAELVVFLIDTVTGRILHRVTHQNAQGPVHTVFSENWVVYHYFNLRVHRYEMSVLELYDLTRMGDKGVLQLILGRHNASAPVSSFSIPSIEAKSQTYYFSFSIKAMAVTSTAKGITSKQLLLGTINDQVLAMDKRFFDPRRSLNPTPAEKEEGILPLTDVLPIIPQSFITHVHQVEGLRGIVTIPASLESTCLVFVYGLDLFYTVAAPSRTYDSLTEDFSYALLLITIVALLVSIVVTWVLSERKELVEKWK